MLVLLAMTPAFAGQTPARAFDPEDISIDNFLRAVETSISTMDQKKWVELLSPNADRDAAIDFFSAMVPQGITRAVIKERDRAPLAGALPGEGYRLMAEVFIETGARGRISTWRLDIRRPRGDDLGSQPWRIVAEDRLASIEGLHRLSLHPERQFAARNLLLKSVDFELRLPAGDVFVAETAEGVTSLVMLGDGTLTFAPGPKEEKGQLRLFAGTDAIETPFSAAFVRLNPFEFEQSVPESMLEKVPTVDGRSFRRAQTLFDEQVGKSFSLDLSDLSRDTWSLLPSTGDFVAEVRTRRYDDVTFARSSGQPEDVSLFQRARKRNIAAYASPAKLESRGRFYDEDDLVEYDILDYNIDVAFQPERDWIDGTAKIRLRIKSYALGVLTMKLAESLNVASVYSDELGRLLFLKVRNQNSIVINLPTPVMRDYVLTLNINYSGRLERQRIQDESLLLEQGTAQPDDMLRIPAEPKWLFSNRNYWHPQAEVSDYATATIRVTVPEAYDVVASGVPTAGSPLALAATTTTPGRLAYGFAASQPIRYLSVLISRMNHVDAATVALDIVAPPARPPKPSGDRELTLKQQIVNLLTTPPAVGERNTIGLSVEANKRQESKGRDTLVMGAEILRLYAGILNDAPYDTMTLALVEDDVPGGHAPGYYAMINNPPPATPYSWRNDPASFPNFPEFFVAHELAHQWFGQAVGWENYHEQWLSEGFAQYFAALYAQQRRGDGMFREVLKQFRKWGLEDSDQGPVYLGYRLGHIKNESRVFRALVYNKGALVIHMLRRIVGDEAFFSGLKKFYAEHRFKKAGTGDLRKAMEAASGKNLERFFEQWIFDSTLPRVKFSSMTEGQTLVARFEQTGEVFDLPVTVSITYADGKTVDHVVVLSEALTVANLPLTGIFRSVDVNQDGAALAVITK